MTLDQLAEQFVDNKIIGKSNDSISRLVIKLPEKDYNTWEAITAYLLRKSK